MRVYISVDMEGISGVTRWEDVITAGDLHLNTNLTRVDSSCALRGIDKLTWWRAWRSSLRRS